MRDEAADQKSLPRACGGGAERSEAVGASHRFEVGPRKQRERLDASDGSTARARALRADSTPPETVLWSRLKSRRLGGLKFRRQHPLGPFIADFYCHEARVVVEVDGEVHQGKGVRDAAHDAWMRANGLLVLRIPARELKRDLDSVLNGILRAALGHRDQ